MKIREKVPPVLKALRIAVGWIVMVLGGLLAGNCAFCALAALFGGFETDSFGEQMGLFAVFLVLMCVGVTVLIEGRWIKNGNNGRKKNKPENARPVVQAVSQPDSPQPTEDQKRLEELERSIDFEAGAVQANPMRPDRPAYEEALARLQAEKQTRLRRMTRYMENVSIHDAWKTFTPEQQKRFEAQVDQYSQDVERGGLNHEIAAVNRGIVFADRRPVPQQVAARLEELRKAAAEKERKNTMEKAIDYAVPFEQLLIYPNRIVPRHGPKQILHEEETASFGTLYKEEVALYEENGRYRLVCNKQERSEHGAQWDLECCINATLSMQPQPQHYIPLTRWILSVPWKDLRQYTDEVYVKLSSDTPVQHKFKRYRPFKENRMKNNHGQYGWNCTDDEIGYGFDADGCYLYRTSHWREMPSGLPYDVQIVIKLLPGAEKESDETHIRLVYSLLWWNPDESDRKMWDVRNWLDADYLHSKEEELTFAIKRMPNRSGYSEELNEVRRQIGLLEGK